MTISSVPLVDVSVFMTVGFPSGLAGKESAFSAGYTGDVGSVHWLRRSPGEANGTPSSILA